MLPLSLLVSILVIPFLEAYAAPADIPSAASFYVSNIPDLHQDDTHSLHVYAGHLSSDPEAASLPATTLSAHLFFVLVKARRTADKERLMFWFNGGPGCSAFDGLMMEVGPWVMDSDGIGLRTRVGGWEEYTTMVYIDQPAGTGFSYTSTNRYVHELSEASQQLVEFLRNFYKVFPEYTQIDTYLGGESYAGQYIPYFADAILSSNLPTHLRAIAIGNGWIDARSQYPAYLDYVVKHGIIEENSEDYKKSKALVDQCMTKLDTHPDREPVKDDFCETILDSVIMIPNKPSMCINVYDVRLDDTNPACGSNWPVELRNVTRYLRRKDVVTAFHASAKSESWVECSGSVGSALHNRNSTSSITLLPDILSKIPVLLFAGDQDLICNYVGMESLISAMTWNGEKGLGTVQTQTWTVENAPAGTWVSSRNLTYVKVFNASHMVSYDVPNVAHDMILRFMGMNFSAITDGSARIPSSVGDDSKPTFDQEESSPPQGNKSNSPEQSKAMWEAYYNAGSAALVLVLIFLFIGIFLWCRVRRRRKFKIIPSVELEENIPLNNNNFSRHDSDDDLFRQRKGKERAEPETIFDVGDDEDENNYKNSLAK